MLVLSGENLRACLLFQVFGNGETVLFEAFRTTIQSIPYLSKQVEANSEFMFSQRFSC